LPTSQPSPGVMIASIITRLFLPIAAGLIAMRFLSPILALLIGLALGMVINLLFTKIKKNYATYLQFLWFAGTLGYLGFSIPFINKTTPTGSLGIAIGIALVVVCTGQRFYSTRTRRSDISQGSDNLFRFLPIVSFVVVLVGGIIRLPITTINGFGWNSGGGVIVWVILSVIIAILISMGLAGIYMTIVFTGRGIRESFGFVLPPVHITPKVAKHNSSSQSTGRDITVGYDPDADRQRKEAEAKYAQQEDDTRFNEHMKAIENLTSNE
jgi:hypothetical protein